MWLINRRYDIMSLSLKGRIEMEEKNNNFEAEVVGAAVETPVEIEETSSVEVEERPVEEKAPVEEKTPVETLDSAEKAGKPKKKKNVTTILLGILCLILAGVATFFGLDYFGIIGEEKVKEVVTIEKVPEEVVVEIATSTMAEEYKEVSDLMQRLLSGVERYVGVNSSAGLVFKSEGLDAAVPLKLGLSANIYSDNNQGAIDLLKEKLRVEGFNSVGTLQFLGSAGPSIDGFLSPNKKIACGMFNEYEFDLNRNYVTLTCSNTGWHWLSDAEKAEINEFAEAFKDKTGNYPKVIGGAFGMRDSEFEPYQTVMVNLGGGRGLYYRVSPEAKWQYVTGGQGVPSCSEFDTEDARKAYLGYACWDEVDGTNSEVKL